MAKENIDDLFYSLSRTKKVQFISENIDYASAEAVAGYVKSYLFDVLLDVGNDDYIATYLREKGYEVKHRCKMRKNDNPDNIDNTQLQ